MGVSSWNLGDKSKFFGDFSTASRRLPLGGGLGVGIVAHPQGALAHGIFFPLGLKSSLAIGLRGECSKMGTHLWTEGENRYLRLSQLRQSWSPPSLPKPQSRSNSRSNCERGGRIEPALALGLKETGQRQRRLRLPGGSL